MNDKLPRIYQLVVEEHLRKYANKIILRAGPRQVGKTTCLKQLDPSRTYVTLDDPQARQLAIADPKLFLSRFKAPLLIDEFQYAPQLLPIIKMAVDQSNRYGDYWLTGSQQFLMMKDIKESLAGRVAIFNLLGQKLLVLVDEEQAAGFYQARWNVTNNFGNQIASGLYVYRLKAGEFTQVKKMILMQ